MSSAETSVDVPSIANGESHSSSGLRRALGRRAVVDLVQRGDGEEEERADLEQDHHVLEARGQLGAADADRGHHHDVRDREDHHRGLRAGEVLPAEQLVGVPRADVRERADDEDARRDDRPAADPAEPRAERAGDPGEGRARVLVRAVHVEERARDQEHRDERREQRPGRLEADEDRDRSDDGRERVRRRRRRQADCERLAKPDRVVLELGARRSSVSVTRPASRRRA